MDRSNYLASVRTLSCSYVLVRKIKEAQLRKVSRHFSFPMRVDFVESEECVVAILLLDEVSAPSSVGGLFSDE